MSNRSVNRSGVKTGHCTITRLPSRNGDRMPRLGSIFGGGPTLSVIRPNQYQSLNVIAGLDFIDETVKVSLFVPAWLCSARPICFRLFAHLIRAAAARTLCTAGR